MLIVVSLLLVLAQAGLLSELCFEGKQVRLSYRNSRALSNMSVIVERRFV